MYSEQLLIKLETDTLDQLKKMAEQMGLKLSSFARMILKNFAAKKRNLTMEEMEDIIDTHLMTEAMKRKDLEWYDWKDVKRELSALKEYENLSRKMGTSNPKKSKR